MIQEQKQKTKSINQTKPASQSTTVLTSIPLLDMQDQNFPTQIVQTFRNIGFVIIKNHGISQQLIDQAFKTAREFFQLEPQVKRAIKFNSAKNRGYSGPGQQILDQQNKKNQKKQTIDLGHPDGPQQLSYYPKNNILTSTSKKIYQQLFQLNKKIMKSIEKGLNIQQGSIVNKCCNKFYDQTLRYLYYPQLKLEELEKLGKIRAGAHSDYGTVTLLLQKPGFGQAGLCALNSEKNWVKVMPPDYCVVVNLGDLFQHWTNDMLKSTIHKVQVEDQIYEKLRNGQISKVPERQTLVLFCDPDEGQIFECLPGFGQPKYAPIDGKKYVMSRIQATYGSQH